MPSNLKEVFASFILIGLVLFVMAILTVVSGCAMSEKDLVAAVQADMWLHEKIPAAICKAQPELKTIGVYRVINCSDDARKRGVCGPDDKTYDEFISYCNVVVEKHFSMNQSDLNKWIDQLRKVLTK